MRWLLLLLFPIAAIGRPFIFSWDNAPSNPSGTTTELIVNSISYTGLTGDMATIDLPVQPGQNIDAIARAMPPDGHQCGDPLALCPPSAWSNQVLVTVPMYPENVYATKTWTGFDPVSIAPTFIGEYETAWNSSASPKTTPSITVQSGDVLVAYSAHENATGIRILNVSGGGLIWTLQKSLITNAYAETDIWTATATQNNTFTAQFTGSNGYFGGNVLVFRNSSGIGASVSATDNLPAINLTTTKAKSAIVFITSDWTAGNGSGRTWKNNAIETSYYRSAANYTVYGSYVNDIGAIGDYSIGLNFAALKKYSNIAIEVKGN
jgi:hypothetical protein